jgi:ABC-2 type transport system permease protein
MRVELYISMVVVLMIGPSLISQDLRFNALPLYFSRPLRRVDYFAGKLGVVATFLGMVLIVPTLIAYILGLLFSLDLSIIPDTLPVLLGSLAYGAVIVLSAGTLILALSSLSRNSRYIALLWLGLWFVSGIVGAMLDGADKEQRRHEMVQREREAFVARPRGKEPLTLDELMAANKSEQEARQKAKQELLEEEMRASRSNWRPLVSYTGNMSRIGDQLLNTDDAWKKLSDLEPAEERQEFLLRNLGPQYPWYWSAAVLAVLFGLSACILNFRVRSLDRLK